LPNTVTPNALLTDSVVPIGGKAQTFPISGTTTAAQTCTLGTLFGSAIYLPGGTLISSGLVLVTTAVTTPSHTWMALIAAQATGGQLIQQVLAVTADQLTAAVGIGEYALPFVTPYLVPGDGVLAYFGFMSAGATAGAVLGATQLATTAAFTPALAVTAGTGLTTPPAVGAQTAVFAAGTSALYAVVY
jgi:hypothetical protein